MYVGEGKGGLWSAANKDGMEIGTEKEKEVSKGLLSLWPQYQGQRAAWGSTGNSERGFTNS